MTEKFKNKYRIPSARLQNWDYGWDGAYFITICTEHRKCYFGDIVDEKMQLSHAGIIADIIWCEIKNHAKNIKMGAYKIMPNHMHGILILDGNRKPWETDGKSEAAQFGDDNLSNTIVETRHPVSVHSLSLRSSRIRSIRSDAIKPIPNTPASSSELPPSKQSKKNPLTIGQHRFQNQGKNTISSICGGYKSSVSKYCNRLGFESGWQARFHEHIIRGQEEFDRITNYIENNPKNWKRDKFHKRNG